MKQRANQNLKPGDIIRADDLNKVARNANRAANVMPSSNVGGGVHDNMQGVANAPHVKIAILKALVDIVPRDISEHNDIARPEVWNAVKCVWDGSAGGWAERYGAYAQVAPARLPILRESVFSAYFNTASGIWVSIDDEETSMVEVVRETKNSAGYQDGYKLEWLTDKKRWRRQRVIHILDANDPSNPIELGPNVPDIT